MHSTLCRCKKLILSFLLASLFLVSISPVFAVSYVDLERTAIGELNVDYGFSLNYSSVSTQYCSIADDDSLDVKEITVEFWCHPTYDGGLWYDGLVTKWHTVQYGWRLNIEASRYRWRCRNTTGYTFDIYVLGVATDVWQHVVGTYNDSVMALYEDTVLLQSVATNGYLANNTRDIYLGICYGSNWWANGICVEELRIYNRVINATERAYSFNGGQGRNQPLNSSGLVLWLKFNEGEGNTAYDETAYNNDATLINSPSWVTGEGNTKPIVGESYPQHIIISELEPSFEVKLYNSTDALISNVSTTSEGIANLTLPYDYRYSTFEGAFRIYDDNSSFLYSKWLEDIAGGDIYEARTKIAGLASGVIALVVGLLAFVVALSSVKGKR